MSQEKKYWKSEVELKPNDGLDKIRQDEFVEKLPIEENIFSNDSVNNADTNRRDFLKYLGFSTTAAVLASCEGPVHKSVPYVDSLIELSLV
jgi:MoCo/4Fe-4S cofactor protein with predicted Tat translocation signal